MAINMRLPAEEWKNLFVTFSNGNRGRSVRLEVFDSESGSTGQRRQGRLIAVDYDPVGEGNDIVVTTGESEVDYSHTIAAPIEVWRVQLDSGEIGSLEIVDQNGTKAIVCLEC